MDVEITVLFFAKSRELTGTRETTLHISKETTATELLSVIISKYNSLDVLKENVVLSLNEEYISVSDSQNLVLNSGDTVAVIPPISGG
ncbi:molybdopterin synthase sulfur carrier subunit-like [Mercenaria mercenaria]|uniref:molybdopterin synthase sulfur carrier subunit-like n=1 Tax=Mercenaria mercenaria TaxID=6596 RepID=UPI00234F6625|nr:molybdopterin synthase sulfur carrier subunit-like [Mercenaria mercenaria]